MAETIIDRETMEQALENQQIDEDSKELSPESQEIEAGQETPEGEEPEVKESVENSKEKALKDTKAWATRLAQENAELKKTVEAFKAGQATKEEVKDAQKAVADTQASLDAVRAKVYEDYPELKDVLEPLFKDIAEIKASKAHEAEKTKHAEALNYFNANVKPKILEAHSDFDEILFKKDAEGSRVVNDEYFEWASKQRPALKMAAMDSSDPEDIIWAVTEYKKFKGSDEAAAIKASQEKEKKQKIINAQTLRGGGMALPAVKEKISEDDISIDEWIKKRNKEKYGG